MRSRQPKLRSREKCGKSTRPATTSKLVLDKRATTTSTFWHFDGDRDGLHLSAEAHGVSLAHVPECSLSQILSQLEAEKDQTMTSTIPGIFSPPRDRNCPISIHFALFMAGIDLATVGRSASKDFCAQKFAWLPVCQCFKKGKKNINFSHFVTVIISIKSLSYM